MFGVLGGLHRQIIRAVRDRMVASEHTLARVLEHTYALSDVPQVRRLFLQLGRGYHRSAPLPAELSLGRQLFVDGYFRPTTLIALTHRQLEAAADLRLKLGLGRLPRFQQSGAAMYYTDAVSRAPVFVITAPSEANLINFVRDILRLRHRARLPKAGWTEWARTKASRRRGRRAARAAAAHRRGRAP